MEDIGMERSAAALKRYWKELGPGLITGAADDDPSGIATYSQTGAATGFHLLWLALFTYPLMSVVQEVCARIGLVSGRGLAENIRREYPAPVLWIVVLLLFAVNAFNIAADIAAMAAGVQLIVPQMNATVLVFAFALLSVALQVFTSYESYARYLKYLTFVLFAYIATGLMIHLDWGAVIAHAVTPALSFSHDELLLVAAILGTSISPYLFFWQSSQEVEEEIERGRTTVARRRGATEEEVREMRVDVWTGMFVSNLVMFFIVIVCAGTLFAHGVSDIQTAADAAAALAPLAGRWATLLFAVGIIGTGLLAVPVLAGSSAYAIAETMHWHEGLYNKLRDAHGFYGIIALSMLAAIGLNVIGMDPIKALIYAAVGNGLVAPIMLFFIMRLSADPKIMGRWTNTPTTAILGWIIIVLMAAVGLATLWPLVV